MLRQSGVETTPYLHKPALYLPDFSAYSEIKVSFVLQNKANRRGRLMSIKHNHAHTALKRGLISQSNSDHLCGFITHEQGPEHN